MPSTSSAQQMMMVIAAHSPSKLAKRNRGVLRMSQKQLEEFASTKRRGLPKHANSAAQMMKEV